MFDVSLTELMVIGVVALIVIGPERLPKVARTVGHLLGRAQRYVNDVKSDIQREIELDELRKFKSEMETAAQDVQQSLNDTHNALQEPVQQFRAELDEVAREASGKPAITAGAETATASADPRAAAPADPLMTPQAGQPAEAPRSIAPPNPNLSLDLDSPAAAPAAQPAPTPQPAPAPHAPAASEPPPATKPATPSGTTT
ncbi:Sec-independent protein translocase protein TatB [Achromobacter xylosoxidans]|uniref:Sec-independent protein translocase protein TatB n=2 Tax=Alcaligenes xylosoxydans xylosoxydans TaxID=85698 RepID=UPI0006BFBA01|nr:Sec-independent protein translocase protein TatB [Achromobacter xylosoxidans]AXA75165.1 twin-arginine translocase subunit TatB [Achromobacter xylosoxidans]KAA5919765.1 Sec-independent protein translocase subunit TatB [Achromobacter xylosoxidans]QKI70758.1 Sec-independent protein translocase subunit TatB [Achromobacter xylosoxidans]QQE55626.1 Sec-independent protein translocase subunit TatB [Achromobacter xylosoxidans]QQV15268.1 Sec-independent protein translocase subunit TatB [Achromobacter